MFARGLAARFGLGVGLQGLAARSGFSPENGISHEGSGGDDFRMVSDCGPMLEILALTFIMSNPAVWPDTLVLIYIGRH